MQAKLFALVLIAVGVAEATKCPDVTASTFDIKSVAGKQWYLKKETPQSWFFPNKCTRSTFGTATQTGVPATKEWRFTWFPFSLFKMSTKYDETASTTDINEGKFTETKQGFLFHPKTTYQVLDASSSSYMILYSCQPHLFGKTEIFQVLSSSSADLTADVNTKVEAALKKVGLTTSLKDHDQSCWTKK